MGDGNFHCVLPLDMGCEEEVRNAKDFGDRLARYVIFVVEEVGPRPNFYAGRCRQSNLGYVEDSINLQSSRNNEVLRM